MKTSKRVKKFFKKIIYVVMPHRTMFARFNLTRVVRRWRAGRRLKRIKKPIFIGLILALVIVGIYFVFFYSQTAEASWFNTNWHYRALVSITGGSSAQTDFQVLVTTDTSDTAKFQTTNSCRDIRFTTQNGELLYYWIESGCGTSSTKIWVKVPSIPTSGATIYMYYGNPTTTDTQYSSSTTNVFIREISNVIGAWNMDEGSWNGTSGEVKDFSGNSINGTAGCEGTCSIPTTTTGKFGNAGSFDGIDDYVNLTNTSTLVLGTDNFTILAWFKSDGNYGRMVTKGSGSSGWSFGYWNWRRVTFSYNNDLFYYDYTYEPGPWHQIAIVRNGNSGTIYVDGDDKITNSTYFSGKNLTYGSAWDAYLGVGYNQETTTYFNFFDGILDEARIYRRALSSTEISDLYGTGGDRHGYVTSNYANKELVRKYDASVSAAAPGTEEKSPGPVAYWKFDEGYGTATNDATSNNNDGTITGATWQTEDMCISGKCLEFDGTNDSAPLSTLPSITAPYSVEFWFKPQSLGSTQTIVSLRGVSSYPVFNFHGNNRLLAYAGGEKYRYGSKTFASDDLNKWWHVVFIVADGASLTDWKVYLNGVDNTGGAGANTGTYYEPSSSGAIGTGQGWFHGFIDDVKIYSYARSAAQVKADYNAGRSRTSTPTGSAGAFGSPTSLTSDLSDGLVGYWKMDESSGTSVADSSGNANTGTATDADPLDATCLDGDTPPPVAAGKYANARDFDGCDDYVDIVDINAGTVHTIEAWVKLDGWNSPIITRGNTATVYAPNIDSTNIVYRGGKNQTAYAVGAAHTITLNTWHHVAVTRDNFDVSIYQDGTLLGSGTIPAGENIDLTANEIGRTKVGGWFFNGTIDEVRIYNRALSAREVRHLYEWAPGPIGYWNFENMSGNTVYDSSGNSQNGTIVGTVPLVQGKYGKAAHLDGQSSNYISVGNITLKKGATISFWVKPLEHSDANVDGIIGSAYFIDNRFVFGYANSGGGNYWFTYGSNYYGPRSTEGYTEDANEWHYLSLVYDGTLASDNLTIYRDGILLPPEAGKNPVNYTGDLSPGYEIRIGKAMWDIATVYIDEVKIYDYPRTQKQIIQDMQAGHPSQTAPIGYWKFDEGYGSTANDEGLAGNNGTLQPGTLGSNTTADQMWDNAGKFNKALEFDGTDDYVDVGNDSSLNITDSITVTGWVKPDVVNTWQRFASRGEYNTGWIVGITNNGKADITALGVGVGYVVMYGLTTLQTGTWYHITGVIDSSTQKISIYLNGQLDNTAKDFTGSIADPGISAKIGKSGTGTGYYFDGLIDEVKIYNYALTQDDIRAEYNRGKVSVMGISGGTQGGQEATSSSAEYCIPGDTATCSPPVAEWKFDEHSGTTAYDTSGNGNTGTLTNMEESDWTLGKVGGALEFDGSNEYVYVSDSDTLDTSDGQYRTLTAWINNQDVDSSVSDIGMIITKGSNNNIELRFKKIGVSTYILNGKIVDSTAQKGYAGDSATTLSENTWYYVAIVHDGSSMKYYVNGVLDSTITTTSGNTYSRANNLDIGRRSNWSYFDGKIDQVRIYDYARTPAQIAWDYNKGKPVAHWKFDKGEGPTLYDSTGNGNKGTITIGATGTQTKLGSVKISDTAAAWYNGRNGKQNYSLSFDGTDDYVDVGDLGISHASGSATVSFWMKSPSVVTQGIAVNYGDTSTGQRMLNCHLADPTSGKMACGVVSSVGSWQYYESNTLSNSAWYHFTLINDVDNSKFYFYQDGILLNSGGTTYTGAFADPNKLRIGNYISGGSYWYNGQIDDVRIYNYALTIDQIKSLHNLGAAHLGTGD